ncbi:MAG: valine--tRNA ligase [Candidatus Micrarchaeia archaeon]
MMDENYSPTIEKKIALTWNFEFPKRKKKFAIDTPPPYPSGKPWHIAAVSHYAQIDMIARTARMLGYEVLFPIGMDRNGIPVERFVEKTYNKLMNEFDREEFIDICNKELDSLEEYMIQILKLLGFSADFKNLYRTDSEDYALFVQKTFIDSWKKGLIYKAKRPSNYCIHCQTVLADADIVYTEKQTKLYYIKFGNVEVATTRPELIEACVALVYNPNDQRYKHLYGKEVEVPISKHKVKVYEHPSVSETFGTGIEMVCTYGDSRDLMIVNELGIKEERNIISTDGKLINSKFSGMKVEEAREAVLKELKEKGLVTKEEEIVHTIPVHDRCSTPIEIIPIEEYYIKQMEFKEKIREESRKMKFLPEMHRQILEDWITSINRDWPISRRRFKSIELPVWYCKKCGKPYVPENLEHYVKPWKEKPPEGAKCECGSKDFIGDERTFDTWFASSVSCLYITKFYKDKEFFKDFYPVAVRPQGKEIVRTWLFYSLLRGYQLTDKLPFKTAWIGGWGLDEKGQKMSKSLGNVIDPLPIIQKYGADRFRIFSAIIAQHGYDYLCSERLIDEKSRVIIKIWNVFKFISQFPKPKKVVLTPTDKLIIEDFSKFYNEVVEAYKEFNFFKAMNLIIGYILNTLAPHYLEMLKPRAYGKENASSAHYTLHYIAKNLLVLLAPIIPFLSDYVWQNVYSKKSIHLQKFKKLKETNEFLELKQKLISFNEEVWKEKKKAGKSLKDEIQKEIPKELKPFEKDLILMHHIKAKEEKEK